MKKQGVRRLIVTSTLSAKDPHDLPEFRAKTLVAIVRLAMRAAYEEIVDQVNHISNANRPVTIGISSLQRIRLRSFLVEPFFIS